MSLRPKSLGWRFFYVSTLVVVFSGILTLGLFLLFVMTDTFKPTGPAISLSQMDSAMHAFTPQFAAAWEDRQSWSQRLQDFRRERRLAPARMLVVDPEGRILYREDEASPVEIIAGGNADRLNRSQLIELLAGKGRIMNKMAYAVAPIQRRGKLLGVLVGYLQPYPAGGGSPPLSQVLLLALPVLATLIVSALAGLYLARGLRKRLAELTGAIQAMAEGEYRNRLTQTEDDELGRVAGAFNAMADRLAEARAQEEALERLKRELITNVSHDLRGPLTSMQGYLEALEDGLAGDPATVRKYLGTISQKTVQLSHLVEDLLLYARLESGNLPLERRPAPVADWLRESLAAIEPDLALAGLDLAAEIPEAAGEALLDTRRMDQVVANLAQNAVRHAPRGTAVLVDLRVADGQVWIAFANKGSNLASEDLPHLFERFYRGRGAEGMGAGLGLAIADQIVRAHGGRIWAENLPGEGVAFRFTLPLQ